MVAVLNQKGGRKMKLNKSKQMNKFIVTSGLIALLSLGANAQSVQFQPGKLAVFRGGDGILTISLQRQHPAFIDEYDPVTNNQASPLMSVELPTNGVNSMWFNAHAGSEGQGFTRSADRQYLAVTGYHGDMDETKSTPSSTNAFTRGFGVIDAFTNFNVIYQSQEWFGIQPGITQNNPRGIATDGANDFWGCGTIAGTQSGGFSESGTLFWNGAVSSDPEQVQGIVNSAYSMKIINGVLYMVAQTGTGGALNNGIYDFVDFSFNGGALVPLPWAPGNVQHVITTNLFLNFGSTYTKVLTFDMDSSNTTVYAADNKYGIVKFVNNAGVWTSPYIFGATNIGTLKQSVAAQGCFGVVVDFSGTNPVIYATTMEQGDGANTCSNRLIRIVDTGAPGTNLVAQTLAVANGINEVFRGVDFTPDLRPFITSQPVDVATTTNLDATFSVAVSSVYPLSYQWQENGTNITANSNITGTTNSTLNFQFCSLTNQGSYSVIVTNQYGSVTSSVAVLTVSAVAVPPSITNAVKHLTNFVSDNVLLSVSPKGTPPFDYQWYFGATQLTDDGIKYGGSISSALSITNVQLSDSGNYFVTVSNSAGGISNLVFVLTVQNRPPTIPSGGQPVSIFMLLGQTNSLSVSSISGTPPLTYQWYQGKTNPVTPLADINEFSGSGTNTLTISGAALADATNYFCVITNAAGSVTSTVASVTVIIPPAPSYLAYTNQVYTQNFDSLPNPGNTPVNTVSGGGPVTIPQTAGTTYSLSNPFDFAFPVYFPSGNVDGLGLSNAMPGWYGECDGDAVGAQLGAHDGSQTTGGIISFGTLDSGNANRALGLIATSTSGGTHFGLKLINQTTTNLNYINLKFLGEYWKSGTRAKTMVFDYLIDAAGTNSTFSAAEIASATNNTVSSLSFGSPYFGTGPVGATNGTLSINQINLGVTNLPLISAWQPGAALWLVWSINDAGGSGQGFGIDNLTFSAVAITNATVITPINITSGSTRIVGSGTSAAVQFTFTNASGLSFSILATNTISAPKTNWPVIGTAIENPAGSGSYQFTDPNPATNAVRFYILRQP
jgi:hypothetical protein